MKNMFLMTAKLAACGLVALAFAAMLFWGMTEPEVHYSWTRYVQTDEKVPVSVILRDGREVSPDSPEGVEIIKKGYPWKPVE